MIIDRYNFKGKIFNFVANRLFGSALNQWFFSTKKRASIVVKIVFKYDDKVLLARKIQSGSLSKVCLPYGFVDLSVFDDNIDTCVKIAYDKMNLDLEKEDFINSKLINVKLDYENNIPKLTYVYDYNLVEREFKQISDSYRLYDFFLLDLSSIDEYNNKKRFVTNSDYVILNNIKER